MNIKAFLFGLYRKVAIITLGYYFAGRLVSLATDSGYKLLFSEPQVSGYVYQHYDNAV
jgi:hypothetical protein